VFWVVCSWLICSNRPLLLSPPFATSPLFPSFPLRFVGRFVCKDSSLFIAYISSFLVVHRGPVTLDLRSILPLPPDIPFFSEGRTGGLVVERFFSDPFIFQVFLPPLSPQLFSSPIPFNPPPLLTPMWKGETIIMFALPFYQCLFFVYCPPNSILLTPHSDGPPFESKQYYYFPLCQIFFSSPYLFSF